MTNLNDIQKIRTLDKENILGSIESLGEQIEQAWKESRAIVIPDQYKQANNIVVAGMGGSALGPHIIKQLYKDVLDVPLEIINHYQLPNYADDNTLCILSSYSGNTEEVMEAGEEAAAKQLSIIGISNNGRLSSFLRNYNFPAYIFEPKFNPSNQPRMGLGYAIAGQLGLLQNAGFLNISNEEISDIVALISRLHGQYGANIPEEKNIAKQLARELHQKTIILVSSEFIMGNIHTFSNQINENSKQFSAYFELPELNHHLMEGLQFPGNNTDNLKFLLINSDLYHPRVQARYPITAKIIEKNNLSVKEHKLQEKNKILQSFEMLALGSYISFYLAMLNDINPAPVPFVDEFKEELNKI